MLAAEIQVNTEEMIFIYPSWPGMSEEMFEEGYQYIHNIDVSSVVIKSMNEKYRDKGPNFKCTSPFKTELLIICVVLQMDARSMEYEDSTFDIVIDKGTLDSLLVSHFNENFIYLSLSLYSAEKALPLLQARFFLKFIES